MRSIAATIKHEMRELLPAVIVIMFNIIGVTKVLMLREYGITVSAFIGATFGALMVAKAVLYALATFMIQVLEEILRALLKHGTLDHAWDMVAAAFPGNSDLAGHDTLSLLHLSGIDPRARTGAGERDLPGDALVSSHLRGLALPLSWITSAYRRPAISRSPGACGWHAGSSSVR
jgi:hypothetical protein